MTPAGPSMGFVGVTTGSSSMMRIFPRWARELGLPARRLQGYDLPLDATRAQYRGVVAAIRDDDQQAGALVTTHKIGIVAAAGDLFDALDPHAERFGEVSCIVKRSGELLGFAKDPVTARVALDEFVAPDHFARTAARAVCLGAGGAGSAITSALARRASPPHLIMCTDTDPGRLEALAAVHRRSGLPPDLFRYHTVGHGHGADDLVRACEPGALVVNATGLGKDRPGSPLSDDVDLPRAGIVWDINYRGTLELLGQARRQRAARDLTVVDGWRYFIHGWAQVIAEIFDVTIDAPETERLAAVAAELR